MGSISSALAWFMEQVGFAVCHQLPERSLSYGDRVMPVCARDTGLFLGFTVCALALLLAFGPGPRRYPGWPKLVAIAAFFVPAALDALTSYAGLRESNNTIRLVTGSLAGVGLAALVFPLAVSVLAAAGGDRRAGPRPAAEEPRAGDDSMERARAPISDPPRAFEHWWTVAVLLLIPATVTLALSPGWSWAYWVWAPLVTVSILLTFFALNLVLAALVFDWARQGSLPALSSLAAIAAGAAAVEVLLSNRLHWLVLKLL